MFDITKIKSEFEEVIKSQLKDTQATLNIIQFGEDFASTKYINLKLKKADSLGIKTNYQKLPMDTNLEEATKIVNEINTQNQPLIVQLPLPDHLYPILEIIKPSIDIDLLNPKNNSNLLPPTIRAIDLTLKSILLEESINGYIVKSDLDLSDQTVAVVGQGKLVGLPLTKYLNERRANIITIDEFTKNPEKLTKSADIVISAVGKPKLINESWLNNNSIVIDAGTSESKRKLVGDVDYENINDSIILVRPPKGIGSLTILSLFYNVLNI